MWEFPFFYMFANVWYPWNLIFANMMIANGFTLLNLYLPEFQWCTFFQCLLCIFHLFLHLLIAFHTLFPCCTRSFVFSLFISCSLLYCQDKNSCLILCAANILGFSFLIFSCFESLKGQIYHLFEICALLSTLRFFFNTINSININYCLVLVI